MQLNRTAFIYAITILSWVVISLFVKPGYFDPITPSHSDLFRYTILSQETWNSNSWIFPRPLMIAYLKIVGITNNQTIFFLLLTLPAVLFISTMLITVEFLMQRQLTLLSIVVYFAIVFGSPLFLAIAQYDFGGSLSGIFTCLSIIIFNARDKKNPERFWLNLIVPVILFWISIEIKPTFAISMLGAITALILVQKFSRKSIYILLVAISMVAVVFIKDALLGSAFIQLGSESDVYTIGIDPIKNITLLAFYIRAGFPDVLLVGLITACCILLLNNNKVVLMTVLFVAIGAAVPMALLVNREWNIYGWYPQAILALSLCCSISLLQEKISIATFCSRSAMLTASLLVVLCSVMLYAFRESSTTAWTVANQKYAKSIMLSISSLDFSPHKKYFFANLLGPYHPFRNTLYIKNTNLRITDFDVLLRESERAWNGMSHEQTNGVYMASLNIAAYDTFYVFDVNGRVVQQLDQTDIQKLSRLQIEALFLCGVSTKAKPDMPSISKALECFNREAMYDSSIAFFDSHQPLGEEFSWLYYHYAQALNYKGKKVEAIENIKKAINAEPSNAVFLKFLNSLE
jgi:tetratricopeptide (TPR) repeat protein